jgi:hypothetical protein
MFALLDVNTESHSWIAVDCANFYDGVGRRLGKRLSISLYQYEPTFDVEETWWYHLDGRTEKFLLFLEDFYDPIEEKIYDLQQIAKNSCMKLDTFMKNFDATERAHKTTETSSVEDA